MWAKWLIWSFFFIHKTAVLPMPQEWKECKHRWRKTATTARGKKKEEKKSPQVAVVVYACGCRWSGEKTQKIYGSSTWRRQRPPGLTAGETRSTTQRWHAQKVLSFTGGDVRRHEPSFSGRTGWKEDKKWQGRTPDNIHSFSHNMIWTSPMRHTNTHTLTCTSCNNWSIAVICLLSGNFFREESQVCVCV